MTNRPLLPTTIKPESSASLKATLLAPARHVLVGAPWHGGGAAYVFNASEHGWHQTAEVTGRGTDDNFGYNVALGPGLAAVGAPGQDDGRA
jgi:FG-GAP repeat